MYVAEMLDVMILPREATLPRRSLLAGAPADAAVGVRAIEALGDVREVGFNMSFEVVQAGEGALAAGV